MRRIILYLLVLLLYSCKENVSNVEKIDVAAILDEQRISLFNNIFEMQECIVLRSSNSGVLTSTASILSITEQEVIIRDRDNIYRYDRNGLFLNLIGVFGHGYSEHGKIVSACADDSSRVVYLLTFDKKIYKYSYDGIFVGILPIVTEKNESIKSIYIVNHMLLCEHRKDNGYGIIESVCKYNGHGHKVQEYLLYSDNKSIPVTRESFSIGYQFQTSLHILLDYDNILYSIADSVSMHYTLSPKALLPDRSLVEDMRMKSKLLTDKLQILDIRESLNFIYFIAYFKHEYYGIVYDKRKRSAIYSSKGVNPKHNQGIKIRQSDSFGIWPTWNREGIAASIIPSDLLSENEDFCHKYLISKDLEDDTPILCIYRETEI